MGEEGHDHTGARRLRGRAGQAAIAAGAFALGAGATAGAASQLIDGKDIKHGSIPLDALSARARAGPRGHTGPRGATGQRGARGLQGQKGATGAKGAAGLTGPTGSFGPSLLSAALGNGSATQQFISPANGAVGGNSVGIEVPVPPPGFTASSLGVSLPVNGTDPLVFTLVDFSGDTALSCTVETGAQTCADDTDSVPLPTGTVFDLRVHCGTTVKCIIPTLTAGIRLKLEPSS